MARLRRPTLVAWAVDHLALHDRQRIGALMEAGERLRRAHHEVVSGGEAGVLHRAAEERRALIATLADEALEVLRRRGGANPDAHREEIEATLEAASSDAEVGDLVRRGRLVTAVPRPAGFPGISDAPLPAGSPSEPGPEPDPAGLERDRQEAARLEELAAEASAEADRARSTAEQAAAEVERLEGELVTARARAAAAKDEARQARRRQDEARRAAAVAAERLRRREAADGG